VRGDWRIVERDAETLKAIGKRRTRNVLTNNALAKFAQGLYDPRQLTQSYTYEGAACPTIFRRYCYIVLGTGAGLPRSSDTNLFHTVADTARHPSLTRAGREVRYYRRYMPEEENGPTYTEAGIFEWVPYYEWVDEDTGVTHFSPRPYSYGTLLNHVLIDPPIEKTELKLVDFEITITFE